MSARPTPIDTPSDHGLVGADVDGPSTASRIRSATFWTLLVGHADRDDDELVAAETGHHVVGPDDRAEPLGHLDQGGVAGGVAQRVVDPLEPVEVAEEDPDPGPLGADVGARAVAGAVHHDPEGGLQPEAVGHAR